jgi:hypothetical protein
MQQPQEQLQVVLDRTNFQSDNGYNDIGNIFKKQNFLFWSDFNWAKSTIGGNEYVEKGKDCGYPGACQPG